MEEDYKLAKWLNNELNEEELKAFEESPEFAMYQKIKETSSRLKTPDFDETKILTQVLSSKKAPKVVALNQNWFMKIAAILILGLGMLLTFNHFSKTTEITENGKSITFSLPDASKVILNSESKITYSKQNWENNRKLELHGEAYFRVAKGKKFEVNTDLGKVTVLGTQFNVNSKNKAFEVTCYEGKVKVNYNNEELLLTKGMKVSFTNQNKIESKTAISAPIWTSNELEFSHESLTTIIQELEKSYNVTITNNNINNNQLFTGKIPAQNLDVALKILASTYHLQIVKTENNTYLLK